MELLQVFDADKNMLNEYVERDKKLKFVMNDYFQKSQRMGYKNLLLYGPRGSGKTLAVHALANDLKGKVAQIQGIELFKIPYFSKEFIKHAFGYMQFKPLIVYIKNMEEMLSNMNNLKGKIIAKKITAILLMPVFIYVLMALTKSYVQISSFTFKYG